MNKQVALPTFDFNNGRVACFYDIPLSDIAGKVGERRIIWVTDEHIYPLYASHFPAGSTIILPAGEEHKNIETVYKAIDELLLIEADRDVFILGVGGGIVTDITGFLASIYLRGVHFGFVPTSILAMVDAAVGGKNGVNAGLFKNQVGTIFQPEFLFYHFDFLNTLPDIEWVSGFAEIIKHACIRDADMFQLLLNNDLDDFRKDLRFTGDLVRKNAELKYRVAAGDEHESGQRRLLNFGHTIGHAIENITGLPHGCAISVGIRYACRISESLSGLDPQATEAVLKLLQKYHLPVDIEFDKDKAWNILLHDKKKSGDYLHFILLEKIGHGVVKKISLSELKKMFYAL